MSTKESVNQSRFKIFRKAALFATALFSASFSTAQVAPTFYEVNLRAISPTGDLSGAEARLSEIKKLGCNVVWLMPTYPVGKIRSAGGLGSPYSVADYKKVNPEFGTLADLNHFVKHAHQLHLKVILDWVGNHTSWDNPWITEHKDWYKQDASGNVIIPPGTGWQDVAQLDHSKPAMREEMTKDMEYWVDTADVDGFRCDAADFEPATFWKPLVTELRSHEKKKLLMLAEGSRLDHYSSGFDYLYAWDFCTALKHVLGEGKPAGEIYAELLREGGRKQMHYATNHDEYSGATPIQNFGSDDGAYVAFALSALLGGNPLVYDGQEIGSADKNSFFGRNPLDWSTGLKDQKRFGSILNLLDAHRTLQTGTIKYFGNDDVIAFDRVGVGEIYRILINVRKNASSIRIDSKNVDLAPFEVRVRAGLAS